MTTAPATGVVGVVGVVVTGGVVTGVVGVVVTGGVAGVVGVLPDGLRRRAAAATLLSLTVASLAESGVALATAAAAVLLVPAAASELSPPPHALNTALEAKQINSALLSFIIIYELRKRLETSRNKSARLDVFRRSVISAETNTYMLRTAANMINGDKNRLLIIHSTYSSD
jgi:hypothetical protein